MKKALTLTCICVFALGGVSSAQSDDSELRVLPGYVDLSFLDKIDDTDKSVEVYLREPLLSLVAIAADDELEKVLRGLKMLKVRSFKLSEQGFADVKSEALEVTNKLQSQNWETIIRVREPNEAVDVLMKMVNGRIVGMTVFSLEADRDASFVNIVGEIDLESLAKLKGRFNIPDLDSIDVKNKIEK